MAPLIILSDDSDYWSSACPTSCPARFSIIEAQYIDDELEMRAPRLAC
jgi:hypothetical protein